MFHIPSASDKMMHFFLPFCGVDTSYFRNYVHFACLYASLGLPFFGPMKVNEGDIIVSLTDTSSLRNNVIINAIVEARCTIYVNNYEVVFL